MKLIRSQAEQARNNHVRELEQENTKLRVQLARCKATTPKRSSKPSRQLKQDKTASPAYAQTTLASRTKARGAEQEPATPTARSDKKHSDIQERNSNLHVRLAWNDCKLVDTAHQGDLTAWKPWDFDRPNFLRDTYNTENRAIHSRRGPGIDRSQPNFPSPRPRIIRFITNLQQDQSAYAIYLTEKTGLHRGSCNETVSELFLPHKEQVSIMRRAYELAQNTAYSGCHQYAPDLQRFFYPLGPTMMKFGRSELEMHFRHSFAGGILGWRQTDINENLVYDALFGIIPLRNAVAHSNSCDSGTIDGMLEAVQVLAVTLHDSLRAEQARALRDELQEKSLTVYHDIVWNRALPFAPEWDVHHQLSLDKSLDKVGRTDISASEAVIQAAREWKVGDADVGSLDGGYISRCEKASWDEEDIAFANSMSGEEREFFDGMRIFEDWTVAGEDSAGYLYGGRIWT